MMHRSTLLTSFLTICPFRRFTIRPVFFFWMTSHLGLMTRKELSSVIKGTGGYELLGSFRRLPSEAAAKALQNLVPVPPAQSVRCLMTL